MSGSPIDFTKAFERLRPHIADPPAPDLKLRRLADFWPELSPRIGKAAYQNYFDEYIPLLLHLICQENLTDLTIDELRRLLEVSHSLIPVNSTQIFRGSSQLNAIASSSRSPDSHRPLRKRTHEAARS